MDLQEAVAELVLGVLRPEVLPQVCTGAMLDGYDSPSLAVLAGEPTGSLDPIEARALFKKVVRELGLSMPSPREAADFLVECAAVDALTGRTSPYQAISRIVREIYYASDGQRFDREHVGDSLGIARLIGLYWDYDELHQPWACSRAELDQESLQALQEYLNARAA